MSVCIACGANAMTNIQDKASRTIYNCPNCGVFVVSEVIEDEVRRHSSEIASFLMSRFIAKKQDTILISYNKANKDKEYIQLTVDQILDQFPRSFSAKMDKALENLVRLSKFGGDEIKIDRMDRAPLVYPGVTSFEALSYMLKSMQKADLIDINHYGSAFFPCGVVVGPKGWDRYIAFSEGEGDVKSAFVSLPAGDDPWCAELRLAVRKVLQECGFALIDSRSVSTDNKIGFALIAEVKRSQLLICDLSDGSGESYYAAGLAWALDKKVILTCRKQDKCKLKVNTDQMNIIIWDDKKQLYLELQNYIRAVALRHKNSRPI